jgi:hypothetical protein
MFSRYIFSPLYGRITDLVGSLFFLSAISILPFVLVIHIIMTIS